MQAALNWLANPQHLWFLFLAPGVAAGIGAAIGMVKDHISPPRP